MNLKDIGQMIYHERSKNKITLQELSYGLCSISSLTRLENGERIPDFFILERLLERLGKSTNKLELLYDEVTYEIYYLRELIENNLEQKHYLDVENALIYYKTLPIAKETLHHQYINKIYAVLLSESQNDHKQAISFLENSIKCTIPAFAISNLKHFFIGESELILILMWIYENALINNFSADIDGNIILTYIEKLYHDEEVLANVYSKAAWVFADIAFRQQKYQESLQYLYQGANVLTANGLLLHLPQFLERILMLSKILGLNQYHEWKKQRDALKRVYEIYSDDYKTMQIDLWKNFKQQEVYLVSELFQQERTQLRKSQEHLADTLNLDQKTISRIETGKYRPKPGTFQKLKNYLKIDRDICTTRLVVNTFSLLELERNIAKRIHLRDFSGATLLYEQLKSQLSVSENENRQYIQYMDTMLDTQNGLITPTEAIARCLAAFQITRKSLTLEQLDQVVLSRTETLIINYITICYDRMNQKEKSIILLEKVINGYKTSKVDEKYHYVGLALIYSHLCTAYEENGQLLDSIRLCEKGIRFELKCNRGSLLGHFVDQRAYSLERMKKSPSSQEEYRWAYQLYKLMQKKHEMQVLYNVYKKDFQEEIDV